MALIKSWNRHVGQHNCSLNVPVKRFYKRGKTGSLPIKVLLLTLLNILIIPQIGSDGIILSEMSRFSQRNSEFFFFTGTMT